MWESKNSKKIRELESEVIRLSREIAIMKDNTSVQVKPETLYFFGTAPTISVGDALRMLFYHLGIEIKRTPETTVLVEKTAQKKSK